MAIAATSPSFSDLGWSADRARGFAPHAAAGLLPGRVVSTGRSSLAVTPDGPAEVLLQRRSVREAGSAAELPAVGDWLALEPVSVLPARAALREVLPRQSAFLRQRFADGLPQVLAANLDVALLVSGLDHDLNLRRIERYLVLALEAGVRPVVVLNKVDAAIDLPGAVADVHAVAAGARVVITSALTGTGVDEIRAVIEPGLTACLLGSSGVGKSTLTNTLLGDDRQEVRALREDDSRGRHTTTQRELFVLPGGGLLIDTPGLRTVGVLGDAAAVEGSFGEIERLAADCRFTDCAHEGEPGCAVMAAIEAGTLTQTRLASHQKLEAERRSVELRADIRARRETDRRMGRMYRSAALARRQRRGDD